MSLFDIIKLVAGFLAILAIWCLFWGTVWAIYFPLKHIWQENPFLLGFLFLLGAVAYWGLRTGVGAYNQRRKKPN